MRTTLNLDDHLIADARSLARQTGRTLTAVIEDALRERLARQTTSRRSADTFRLHTFTGTGLNPGIDLDNTAALRDLMDDFA
jgi:hypothetical protein